MNKNNKAFTLIELMVIVAIMGILVVIITVSYVNITKKSSRTSLANDLQKISSEIELIKNENNTKEVTSLPTNLELTKNSTFQLGDVSGLEDGGYCIEGHNKHFTMSITRDEGVKDFGCDSFAKGNVIGGPTIVPPKGHNTMPPFSEWEVEDDIYYDFDTKELCTTTSPGNAKSPYIRISGSTSIRFSTHFFASTASPNYNPKGGRHYGSSYYNAQGVAAYNTGNYTGNGNAGSINLNIWEEGAWSIGTGPNVDYIRMTIYSSPTTYTGETCYKDPELIIVN